MVTSLFTYVGDREFFSLGIPEIPQQTRRKQQIDKGRITDQQPRRSPDLEWVVGPRPTPASDNPNASAEETRESRARLR